MKNEYGKKDYQNKGYQASPTNKQDNRKPSAPTTGGFPKTGDQGKQQQKNPQQQQYNKQQTNTWGKNSISGDKGNQGGHGGQR